MTRASYQDRHGIAFADYRKLLPARCSDWPQVRRVKNPQALAAMHYRWQRCQVCGRGKRDRVRLEVHHIIGGTKGRADEPTNLIMLCAGGTDTCHEKVNTSALPMSTILWALWRTNPRAVDWCRLALLHRHHLPEPMADRRLLADYRRRSGLAAFT